MPGPGSCRLRHPVVARGQFLFAPLLFLPYAALLSTPCSLLSFGTSSPSPTFIPASRQVPDGSCSVGDGVHWETNENLQQMEDQA
eukprot:768253-Hanusia_phi.AAC.3